MAETPTASVSSSLETLKAAQAEAREQHIRRAAAAEYAKEVLRGKGQFLFTSSGHFGGSGAMGGIRPGTLYTQGTRGVVSGDSFIALRDQHRYRAKTIELVEVEDTTPLSVKSAPQEKVVATFENNRVILANVGEPTEQQFLAILALVETIDSSIEQPLEQALTSMPAVGPSPMIYQEDRQIIDMASESKPSFIH